MTVKGNAYLCVDNGNDIKILKDDLAGALDGDIVIINDQKQVIKIVDRARQTVVFECVESGKGYGLQSVDNPLLFATLPDPVMANLVPGHRVLLKIGTERSGADYLAVLVSVIGHINEPDIDIKTIAYSYGIYDEFSDEAMAELDNIPQYVCGSDIGERIDLREEEIFTIDGSDTKDIDDAISLDELPNGNYLLGVHIADVNHYIKRGSALFKEAFERSTSVYLADSVIPMLPPELSNGICSLFPNQDRLTITCQMEIDDQGNIVAYNIFESVINSDIKMTYDEVNQVLNNEPVPRLEPYKKTLTLMQKLSKQINVRKLERGYLNFALKEAKITVDEAGKPTNVLPRKYDKAEQIIENFMVLANEQVATHVYFMSLPFPYRIHELPDKEKLQEIIEFIAKLGIKVSVSPSNIHPRSIQKLLMELKNKEEFPVLSALILRGMQRARYDINNEGHFGLALENYTHFTSPIRRYPDLMVHELLKRYIEMDIEALDFEEIEDYLQTECIHASNRERVAMEAEEEVEMMKMAEYMENHVGEEYSGIITYIGQQGVFVQTDDLVRGMVNLHDMTDDYYYFIPDDNIIIGKNTKTKYQIGNRVMLEVVSASKQHRKINFRINSRVDNRVRTRK